MYGLRIPEAPFLFRLMTKRQEEKLLEGFEVKSKMDIVKQQYIEKFDQK